MPREFTKNLNTVSPSLVINEKVYDTSWGDAAEVVGEAITSMGEMYRANKEAELTGNFTADLDSALEEELAARDEIEIERARLAYAHKQGLRDLQKAGASQDEMAQVEMEFNRELDYLTLREQQQGVRLNAHRRAIIRRYKAAYPHMSRQFEQVLDSNRKLEALREEAASARLNPLEKTHERQALALSLGTTPEALNMGDAIIRGANQSKANVEAMIARGESSRYMWQHEIDNVADLHFNGDIVQFSPQILAVSNGTGDITKLRLDLVGAKDQAILGLTAMKQKIEQESQANGQPIRINIDEQIKRTEAAYDTLLKIVTTDDLRNKAEIRRLMRDENRLAFLGRVYQVPPEVAGAFESTFVKDVNSWFEATERFKDMNLAELTAGGGAASDQARIAMNSLATMLAWRGIEGTFDTRYIRGSEAELRAFVGAMGAIRNRIPVSDEDAALASPVLQSYFTREFKTADSPSYREDAARASAGLAERELNPDSAAGSWFSSNSGNANSTSTELGRRSPQIEDEMHTRRTAAILADYIDTYNTQILGQIRFDPNSEKGFSYGNSTRPEFQGVGALQRLYVRRKNTLGTEAANTWAQGIMQYITSKIQGEQAEQSKSEYNSVTDAVMNFNPGE